MRFSKTTSLTGVFTHFKPIEKPLINPSLCNYRRIKYDVLRIFLFLRLVDQYPVKYGWHRDWVCFCYWESLSACKVQAKRESRVGVQVSGCALGSFLIHSSEIEELSELGQERSCGERITEQDAGLL